MNCEYIEKGRKINKGDCVIYFVRHAQSHGNIGKYDEFDTSLSDLGKIQASKLSGHYDLVLCSPLERTQSTLKSSQLTYDKLIITNNLREFIENKNSITPDEVDNYIKNGIFAAESFKTIQERIEKAMSRLEEY